jgi:membrane fusion protein, multidrug efflux system
MNHRNRFLFVATAAALALLGPSCGKKKAASADVGGPPGGMVIPVVAGEARRMPVTENLSLVGSLLANEFVEIKAETEGVVQEVNFTEGQGVSQGDLLLRLDETKFSTALAEAQAGFKLSQATFERAKELYTQKLISSQEYDQASAAFNANQATVERRKRELKDTRIFAPFSGIVGARSVSPGQVIARNTLLTVLVDLNPVKVEVSVPERYLGQVRIGQELELTVAAYPARNFKGKVYFVSPDVDPSTRTALVKAKVENPEQLLKPGMFANLDLTLQVREQAIVIPESALVFEHDKVTVWVIGQDDTVQPRLVKVGARLPGGAEIVEGLQAGERVVVEGIQKVMPGAKVKASASTEPTAVTSAI